MTTNLETQTDEERRYLYTGVAIVLAVLVAVGLFTLKAGATTQAAEDKAAQLITELESAGVSAPSSQVVLASASTRSTPNSRSSCASARSAAPRWRLRRIRSSD